jgi:glycosyltransferase involved in cell wall biosynthesis
MISFVIPCLNEAATIAAVIDDCHKGGQATEEPYEIIVADNGSVDGSQEIARHNGAIVVSVPQRGYGAALIAGIHAAQGRYVLMGDADATYDFRQAPQFLAKLNQGYELVMGNRFRGTIAEGAMPLLHRYLGNPVLSMLGRMFFGIKIGDFHCGLRAFDREAVQSLNLRCSGMEFASELVIKSSLMDLSMAEIPTNLRPNPPGRTPHLKTWRDGWRHLKFMLSFSPKYSLLPLALSLLVLSLTLITLYLSRNAFFIGPNTLMFAASCLVASVSILSDYLLTREMIYSNYSKIMTKRSGVIDQLLGLHQGTDKLFLLALSSLFISFLGFVALFGFAIRNSLSQPAAAISGFVSCTFILISVSLYLTAAKISSYRSLHRASRS